MPNSTSSTRVQHCNHTAETVKQQHKINQFQVLGAELNAGVKCYVTDRTYTVNLVKPSDYCISRTPMPAAIHLSS